MIRLLAFVFCLLCFTTASAQQEVMYHVFVRSFFDSNGDGHGDLKGIQQKLDYLQEMGVTTISLSPVYQSDFYHNLYASDIQKTDSKYGAFKEYRDLIQNIHLRKMKLYQEIDLQYVSTKHLWYTDSFKNTKSAYKSYIYYTDANNQKPFALPEIVTYNGAKETLVAVNLKNAGVAAYYTKALQYWADPDKNGNFNDGVDGFRLVDVQDKIDSSGKTGNLLKGFYAPLFENLKKVNPKIMLLTEAADTKNFGTAFYTKANTDRVMSYKLRESILSFDKKKIVAAADSIFVKNPADKYPVVFIENENTPRVASLEGMNVGKLRAAAGLNFLLGGVPSVYYGQELGMKGQPLQTGKDGDKIPLREAYDWFAGAQGKGLAAWYKDSGAWWDKTELKPNDGISAEEEEKDANSLLKYYRQLGKIKRMQPALALGNYREITNTNDNIVSFMRTYINKETAMYEQALVVINLSGANQVVSFNDSQLDTTRARLILGTPNVAFKIESRDITMTPYAVQVWRFTP